MIVYIVIGIVALCYGLNFLSYRIINKNLSKRLSIDLNICCGKTSYGSKANVDIYQHDDNIPHFVLVDNIYSLPFENQAFQNTLCAHTIEHIDDPKAFDAELRRVSQEVIYIVPPIWDIAAQLNLIEHQWMVLSWKKSHTTLPRMIRNPLFFLYNRFFPQKVKA